MNILKGITNTALSLILSLVVIILVLILNISLFFKEETMEKNIENIDVIHEMKKIQNSTTSGNKAEISGIIEMAYEESDNHGIDKMLVDTIFNDSETKKFFGKIIGSTTDYVINDNSNEIVTSKDFNELLDNNIDRWIKESNTEISNTKKEVLLIRIKELSAGIIDNIPNYKTIDEKVNDKTLEKIRFAFTTEFKIVLFVLATLLLSIIIFINRKEKKYMIPIIFSTGIVGITLLVISIIIGDVTALALKGFNITFIANIFIDMLSTNIFISSLVFIVLALLASAILFIKNKTNTLKNKLF